MASTPEPSAFRLDKAKWGKQAFTGQGASLEGGRWNPAGVSVVYASQHLAMAAMEKLVHLNPGLGSKVQYVSFRIHFFDTPIETLPLDKLPSGWDAKPARAEIQRLGAEWFASRRTAILQVPSAIIPSEWNFVLNPTHPDFARITIEPPVPFAFDPRLLSAPRT
jgi:RES domain-containing protein